MKKDILNTDTLRIGITGGSGVLGTRLVEVLLAGNNQITCLVRESGKIRNIDSRIALIYGDLSNLESIKDFVKDLDVCVHLAAQVGLTTKKIYNESNVIGTENLCKAILTSNPNCKLINCPSIAAYRISGLCRLQFTDYAKSKLAADKIVDYYVKNKALKAVTIIPGLIYGPGKNTFIPTIIENLKNEKLFFIKGGERHAPLSYIDDLCDLFIRAIVDDHSIGNKYFGIKYTEKGIHDFVRLIAQKTSLEAPSKVLSKRRMMSKAIIIQLLYSLFNIKKNPKLPIRMVDVLSINYQLSKAQKTNNLDWIPKIDMEDGIQRVLEQYNLESLPKSKKRVLL